MMCYMDRTWCPFSHNCTKAPTCDRAITDEVHRKAAKWWGGDDYPMAVFVEQPSCHQLETPNENS